MEKYRELFDKDKSTSFDIEYSNKKMNSSYKEFQKYKREKNISEEYDEFMHIYSLIFLSTLSNPNMMQVKNLLYYFNYQSNLVTLAKYDTNKKMNKKELLIKTNEKTIETLLLSDVIPESINNFPELETTERANNCFYGSYEISKLLGIKNNIVTGYVSGFTDKSKYLHSWVETNLKGEDVVIDFTLNAIINKDGYYYFRHAKPISSLSSDKTLNDIENYNDLLEALNVHQAAYNIFRDELVKDFEKINDRLRK